MIRSLGRHRSSQAGLLMLGVMALVVAVATVSIKYDPLQQNLNVALMSPSGAHFLGTDELGRDVLIRLVYGTRYTLFIGLAAVAVAAGIGIPVGAVSGYVGRVPDLLVQRLTDILLAFPGILLALALVAA